VRGNSVRGTDHVANLKVEAIEFKVHDSKPAGAAGLACGV
jgi:hypothetical protein